MSASNYPTEGKKINSDGSNRQDSPQSPSLNQLSDDSDTNSDFSDSTEVLNYSADVQTKPEKSRSPIHSETFSPPNLSRDEADAQTTVGNKSSNKKPEHQQINPTHASTFDSGEEEDKTIEQDDYACQLNDDIDEINIDDQYNHYEESMHRNTSNTKKDKHSKKSNNKDRSHPKKNHGKTNTQTELSVERLRSIIPPAWSIVNMNICGKTHQGYVIKIHSTKHGDAVIKIYIFKEKDPTEVKKLQTRAFQEKIALNTIKGMSNVPQFIDSNIPDSVKEISKLKEPLWIIISYSPGCTLMKLIEDWAKDNTDIQPIESIRFCQELLKTVKCIHSKEIIHRDIKPANIIVDCDKHQLKRVCSLCKLTIIDYGLAHIRTETNDPSSKKYRSSQANDLTLTALQEDIGHSWCRVPQLAKASDLAIRQMTDLQKYEQKQLRRSPTTDASSVCAILFTLLTKEHPGSTRTATGLQPHQKYYKKLQNLIKKSLANTDLQARVEAYLMDTFDKGFGFPDIQWTVEQLEYRLDILLQMMQNTSKENVTMNSQTSQSKIFDEQLIKKLKSSEILIRQPDFIQVAQAFSQAKLAFIKQPSLLGHLQWSSDICQWTDDINVLHEKKHFDILTCSNPDSKWSMLVIFHCYIDDCADFIKLSIGTIIDGVTLLLPVARFNETVPNQMIENRFNVELNTLIRLTGKNITVLNVGDS